MVKTKKISKKKLIALMLSSRNILIATHENPDGDGLGTMVALGMGLRKLGKKVRLYSKDKVPRMYHFLPGQSYIKHELQARDKFDLTLVVDVGEIERVSSALVKYQHKGVTVSIDHHSSGGVDTDYSFCYPNKASTGEIVFSLLKSLKIVINRQMATNLYTAIATDTGSFKYSNTTHETLSIASQLVKCGVDVWDVALHSFETYSRSRIELLKRCFATMQVHPNGKLAWIVVRQKDLRETKAFPEDSEGFINFPRSVEGVEVALMFKERSESEYKVSLRSKKYVDVARLAEKFGGGGHVRASGCALQGAFEKIKKQMISEILPLLA